jgi:hypothetical protein
MQEGLTAGRSETATGGLAKAAAGHSSRIGAHNRGKVFGTPFPKGVSGLRWTKERARAAQDEIIARWTQSAGGPSSFTPPELDLMRQAAILVLAKPKQAEITVRNINAVRKILAMLGLVHQRGPAEPESMLERFGHD